MGKIKLDRQKQEGYTLLPDAFIDRFMASANGEFVKVYISLLRLVRSGDGSFDMTAMADLLCCNERDILRALKYWGEKGLVSLSFTDEGELASLAVCPVPETGGKNPSQREAKAASSDSGTRQKAVLSRERMEELKEDQAVVELLFVAEQYIGRPLSSNEMRRILYFYDGLSMSLDLIQYLIEYCVSHGHKSIRYMESVALSWVDEGITTVKQAQESASGFGKEYFAILKALGIKGRNPVQEEISYMNTWLQSYGFSEELIHEACSRTVMNTGQPSFQYADRILSDWKEQNVKSLSDVEALDAKHRETRASRKKQETAPSRSSGARSNRFNNFSQRQYDFAEYEKQLIDAAK